jgi:hypothetical protein
MPRSTARGDIFAGIGGATVSVWRVTDPEPTPIATNAGGACPLDDDHCLYQQDAHLDTFDLRTGEIVTIDAQGSFELAAGGGVYAAKFFDGVRVSNQPGKRLPGYGVGDVAPDGTVLLKTPDGLFQGRLIEDLQAHGGASWSGLEGRRPVSSPDMVAAHVVPGVIYGFRRRGNFCCYLADQGARFIVQFIDRPVGKVIAVTPNAFRPDLVVTADGLVVTYAEQVDEPPGKIRRFFIAVSELTEDLTAPPRPLIAPPKIAVASYDALLKAAEPWHLEFANTGDGTRFIVTKDGRDRLWIEAQNAAGSDRSGTVRQLTIEGPDPEPEPEPEPPPMLRRYWFQPNIGSKDLLDLFDDPSHLLGLDVVVLYAQHVLTDVATPQLGPNTWPNFVAHGSVQKLKESGRPLVIEMGSVKDGDCQALANIAGMQEILQRVHDAGGQVAAFSADEPITNSRACHQSLAQTAEGHATWTHAVRALGPIEVGWLEAWPAASLDEQRLFLQELKAHDALPDYWHLDIDWNRAQHEHKNPAAFIDAAKVLAAQYGITLGIFVNSTVDPIATDLQHHQNLIALAQKIYGLVPDIAHVSVAAWAHRVSPDPTHATQNVPNNLGAAACCRRSPTSPRSSPARHRPHRRSIRCSTN